MDTPSYIRKPITEGTQHSEILRIYSESTQELLRNYSEITQKTFRNYSEIIQKLVKKSSENTTWGPRACNLGLEA